MKKDAEAKAKENEKSRLEELEADRQQQIEKTREAANVEADKMRKTAEEKENEAIDAIIDKLI